MKALRLEDLHKNPIAQFSIWYDEAKQTLGIRYPDACCLSTVDERGYPDGRMVLVKEWSEAGFCFFTNSLSKKGRALAVNPKGALTFYWDALRRQIRIQGDVSRIEDDESDLYFSSRPREAQLGAWASRQSEPVDSRETLETRLEDARRQYGDELIPRPPHWCGYRLAARRVEFWQERAYRLHDRLVYLRTTEERWEIGRLFP